ncbi:MAG TPA: lipase maturation factor family protein [Terracidiphilus sp.]|nr:lipase maturation factor family protein [Terracidiphilus sp.]
MKQALAILRHWFDPHDGARTSLVARWVFLRALALIYFSAFFSLLFQIKGEMGPEGILPAGNYLLAIAQYFGPTRFWHAPSLFWFSSSSTMLMAVAWAGIAASLLALVNLWPRITFFACFVCFLSFVSSASDFANYQSDGMLLEAGFISLFFAPRGILPGWGVNDPPSRVSLWLLRWEWFRIYFESGLVKELSGDSQWRNLTAMDQYYQNGPLPTWIGWYVQHFPHWFHATTVILTLAMELFLVFMLFFPRRVRLILFLIVTPWEVIVILTANYAFLNYLVFALGFLLLDDVYFARILPARFRPSPPLDPSAVSVHPLCKTLHVSAVAISAFLLTWIAYATAAELLNLVALPILPMKPAEVLDPFRIANQYGLFAVMTRGRYEIEFQGSNDGTNWQPYIFTHKPQLLNEAPGIYAPYQPRFDWNLWFASLGDWRRNDIVPITEEKLLMNDRAVIGLFRSDPFGASPPRYVRAVLWQYWMTSMDEKRRTGNWWRRTMLGLYAPTLVREPDGEFGIIAPPDELPDHD